MHSRIPPIFKVSLLATAVVTLSGCAATADPSRIGDSLMNAGRVTADASVKAFEGTKRILGFDRNDPQLDEVDLALMDKDQAWPADEGDAAVAQPVQTASALKLEVLNANDQPPEGAPAIATMGAIDPNAIPVATVDYTHIVGASETMWTIAKLTTGNANNWRILAEINQLDLNAPMQIGQEVLIPADLVRPEIVASLVTNQPIVDPDAANIITDDAVAMTDSQPVLVLEPSVDADTQLRPIAQAELEADPLNPVAPIEATEEIVADIETDEIKLDGNDEELVAEAAPVVDPTIGAIPLAADAGETLWDMAKRTTGDATNWKLIAEQNGFTERDIGRIRYGQEIYVPIELAKVELGGEKVTTVAAVLPETDTAADAEATDTLVAAATDAAVVAPSADTEAVDASSALVASASNLMDETQEIKIVEAKFQADEAVTEMVNSTPGEGSGQVIMVSGTYYPKAVYNEADFSSSLLMRVSPGTQMSVSRAMGPWFEVQTEHGIGYMHSRDIK